ncbi:MAG: hypothetical protein WC777_03600 [Candidatus Gracilibacteria bacterium]|jgi:hypothetical protein
MTHSEEALEDPDQTPSPIILRQGRVSLPPEVRTAIRRVRMESKLSGRDLITEQNRAAAAARNTLNS